MSDAAEISTERFLKIARIDARRTASTDLLTRLRDDEIQAVVLTDLFSAAECDGIVATLQGGRHGFPETRFPDAFKSSFLGANLNLAHPDLVDYFSMVPTFDDALRRLMAPYGGFTARVLDRLSKLDGALGYEPAGDGDRCYMPTTFRAHVEGGFIPPHFDNEQMQRPTFRHLVPLIQGDLFSFVTTLHRAVDGGALEVYDVTDRRSDEFVNRDGSHAQPNLSTCPRVTFDVADGTMVVMRSGRYLHSVTPVRGTRTRWTFCSFMARSRASDAMLCWG